MNHSRIAKLAAILTLFSAGLIVGAQTPEAEARPGQCSHGFSAHSGSTMGHACSSAALVCAKGHQVFQPTYNSVKKRFDYKCTKSSNIPK